MSLGIGGQAPYDILAALVDDVRMLVGLGATRIPIYSLETTVARFGAEGLKSIVDAGRHPMSGNELATATLPSPINDAVRASQLKLDAAAVDLTTKTPDANGYARSPNCGPGCCAQ